MIFKHPDGSYHRFPQAKPDAAVDVNLYDDNDKNWRQKEGARPGIQIHRDGKRLRNVTPTPPKT